MNRLPTVYNNKDIDILKECGNITSQTLKKLKKYCEVGISFLELDEVAKINIKKMGGVPACYGYNNFPKNICISVDEIILHGIPKNITIKEGMIINIDCPVKYKNFYTDSSINISIGDVNEDKKILNEFAYKCMMDTISIIKSGVKIGDICKFEEEYIKNGGYKTIKEFRSHGVGNNLHEPPHIPHYYDIKNIYNEYELEKGNVFTIEPIVVTNEKLIKEDDGWSYRTEDYSFGTYWEHTVVVTDNGCEILT